MESGSLTDMIHSDNDNAIATRIMLGISSPNPFDDGAETQTFRPSRSQVGSADSPASRPSHAHAGSTDSAASSPFAGCHFNCLHCGTSLGEGRANSQAFKTCSGSGPAGHAAACLRCFSNPMSKSGPRALVQLAAQHAGKQASTLDFGVGRPAVKEEKIMCYVTWQSKEKTGELICVDCWEGGHRATSSEEIIHAIEEEEEEIRDLHYELQAGLGCSPPLGRVEMVDTDTMSRFLRLTEMEESLDECLLLLVEFLSSLPRLSPLANLAGMHLAGNTHDTFNKTTQEDWTRFRLAVQNTIDETRLRLDPQAKAHGAHSSQNRIRLPFPADLLRFGQQAAIYLEDPTGVRQVNKLANDLSDQAQGALYMAGFNTNDGAFAETQHLMLATQIQRVVTRDLPQPLEVGAIEQDGGTRNRFDGTRAPAPTRAHLTSPPPAIEDHGRWPLQRQQAGMDPRVDPGFDWKNVGIGLEQLGLPADTGAKYEQVIQARLKQTADARAPLGTVGAGKDRAQGGSGTHVILANAHGTEGQAQMLEDLFANILQRSDEERTTGICNPSLALTIHTDKQQFQHAALKRTKTAEIEKSLDMWEFDAGLNEVRHRPRLITNTTPSTSTRFLTSFTPEDLTAYLVAIRQYIEVHSPSHVSIFRTLKDWIFNRDVGLFSALGIRAPDDPKSKAIAHSSALGRFFVVRYLVLRQPRSLAAVDKCLSDYCDSHSFLSKSEATTSLLASLGFVQKGNVGLAQFGHTPLSATFPSPSAQALADRAKADALKLAWVDINATSKPCLNCLVSGHNAGACWKERRAELPCQICLGMGAGSPHSEPNCPGPAANNLADWARVSVILWKQRTGHPLFSGPSRHQGGDGGTGTY